MRLRLEIGPVDENGWAQARFPVGSGWSAASDLLRLGAEVEVLEPAELRERMRSLVAELGRFYET